MDSSADEVLELAVVAGGHAQNDRTAMMAGFHDHTPVIFKRIQKYDKKKDAGRSVSRGNVERNFYESQGFAAHQDGCMDSMNHVASILSFLPRFYGVKEISRAPYLVLENALHGIRSPAVLDVKIGHQMYPDCEHPEVDLASSAKMLGEAVGVGVRSDSNGNEKTDGALLLPAFMELDSNSCVYKTLKQVGRALPGFRIIGAAGPNVQISKKEGFGMALIGALSGARNGEPRGVHADAPAVRAIASFLGVGTPKETPNAPCAAALETLVQRLELLHDLLKTNPPPWHAYSSSLLLYYESDDGSISQTSTTNAQTSSARRNTIGVKWIDFAHVIATTASENDGRFPPDENFLHGLRELIKAITLAINGG